MPPEDNKTPMAEDPVTPDMAQTDSNSNGDGGTRKTVMAPTAPRGKPKAPPLIHGKINPSDADGDMSGGSASKIPLLKSKHLESETNGQFKKRSLSGLNSPRSAKGSINVRFSNSTMDVHRTVEKVRLPKGIEMRRVVQESNGIKTKRYSSTTMSTKTNQVSTSVKDSSQGPSSGTRRKMTKTEATFPEVKSFTGHVRPTGSGSSLVSKSKPNEIDKDTNALDKTCKPTDLENIEGAISSSRTKIQEATQTDVPVVDNFKTVDEFLKMPETSIPETKAHSPVKKTIYKSKFWEYIDPKSSSKSKSSSKEQKKPYDPDAVKSFMQKQKEIRKMQQLKESKQKEAESAKRHRMLKELDSKCQKIALKGRQRGSSEMNIPETHADDEAKKPKLETQSPSMKYLKPLLERKQGSLLRKSDSYTRDVAKQSQYLLAEFENIVKRECISFLQKIPIPSPQTNADNTAVTKVDKAVATSASLLDLDTKYSQHKQSQSDDCMDIESLEHDDIKPLGIPSQSTVERAVTKIQACYRGYKVRQALKDAKILYRRPIHKRCSEIAHQNTPNDNLNQSHPSRRWSFPRMPEKPYDNLSKLLPMSPVPMKGVTSDYSVPCYIPPPSATSQATRSPSRPRVLPSFPVTPSRKYDEPYPKQAKNSSDTVDRIGNFTPTPRKDSFQSIHPNVTLERSNSRLPLPFDPLASSSENLAPRSSANCEFHFVLNSSIPSIVDVLREKIRLFSNDNHGAPVNSLSAVSGMLNKASDESRLQKEKSSNESNERKIRGKESGDVSTATTEDHAVDRDDGVTPKIKRHKRRSRPRSQRSPIGDSTTTVDTDAEYSKPSGSRSSGSIPHRQKNGPHTSTLGSKSEDAIRTSSLEDPTTTSSFENFLGPALHLRYEAEREHLKIIEKALQVKLHSTPASAASTESVPVRNNDQSQVSGHSKKSSPETDRVQLAIANCQKESMKAAAEMAKWMSEFQKTTREQEHAQAQQTPVNLAATVIAAVEQARIIGIEKRRMKGLPERGGKQKPQPQQHSANMQIQFTSEEESQSNELVGKEDKSVETSLNLVQGLREGLLEKEKRRDFVENVVLRNLKDYQQQFPSESERDSPLPVVPAAPSFSFPVPDAIKKPETETSGQSTPEPEEAVPKFQDSVDYPSIIPSGNSVEFTSLDPRVSTLDYVSQLSSEKEITGGEISVDEDVDKSASSIQYSSDHFSNVDKVVSGQYEAAVEDVVLSTSHHGSTILDEAASEESKPISSTSIVISQVEEPVISERLEVEDLISTQSNEEIEDEASQSEIQIISTASKVEEQSKLHDMSEHSKIEEDIINSNYTDFEDNISIQSQSQIIEEISKHSNLDDDGSQQSQIHEILEHDSSQRSRDVEEVPEPREDHVNQEASEKSKLASIHVEDASYKANSTDEEVSDHFEVEDNASSDDQFEAVEDKATETEIPEEIESVLEKKLLTEQSQEEKNQDSSHLEEENLEDQVSDLKNDVDQLHQELDIIPQTISDDSPKLEIKDVAADVLDEPSIIEDLVDDSSEDKMQLSQHSVPKDEDDAPRTVSKDSSTAVEMQTDFEDKFEEDVTESRAMEEKVSHITEEGVSSDHEETPPSTPASSKVEIEPEQIAEPGEEFTRPAEEFVKPPPPPYRAPPTSESILPEEDEVPSFNLETSSETSERELKSNDTATSIRKEDVVMENDEVSPQKPLESQNSQQQNLVESMSSPHIEEDVSEQSPIIDETSERSTKDDDSIPENVEIIKSEKQKSEIESKPSVEIEEQPTQEIVRKPEFDIPLKPPPPYSPTSSLESTSLSSRSLMVSLPDDKLEKITREQADIIWEVWKSGEESSEAFPDINAVMRVIHEKNLIKAIPEKGESNTNLQSSAEHSFDVLLCHLIYETMKEVLQIRNNYTSFIERVRPGPLSIQAQKLKIPKTKEALVANVLMRVIKVVPPTFFSDPHVIEADKPRLRKWCSRPRELVDEILLEELVEEDYQWTEWWPEEVIISHHISTKIIQTLIRNALQKRKYVYSQ